MKAERDLLPLGTTRDEGYDLRFGEYRAHARKSFRSLRRRGGIDELLVTPGQGCGNHLEKPACSRGAAIVHRKLVEISLGAQRDDFGVLTSDVNDGAAVREKVSRSPRNGFDFSDQLGFGPVLREELATITGRYQAIEAVW